MRPKVFCLYCLVFLLAAACAINPVTGKRELSLISEQQEIALGQKTDGEILSGYGAYEEPSLVHYVQSIGMALAPHSHRPQLKYHFAVLDSPVINAFAVPGGYIYVTRGILALMNSEAELSVVLGHELGHVNARHSVRRLSEMMLVQIGLALGSAVSETFAKISGVASVGVQLLFLKFSRDDEREADSLGVKYARSGGYDPAEMVSFFAALEKTGDLSGKNTLPGFLSTHPLTKERIQNVKGMIIPSDSGLQRKRTDYLNRIDNLIYGDDPRQGYVEGNSFYHPQMRFSFTFPSTWKAQNTPTQVTLSSNDGNAALVLQAEKSDENLESYAEKKAASIDGRTLIKEGNFTVNSLSGYSRLYDIVQIDKAKLRLQLSVIRKASHIYAFSALSTAADFAAADPVFQKIVSSFNELRDPGHLNRQPLRLKFFKADGKDTLETIFRNKGVKQDLWPKLAILNVLELKSVPEKNRLVKFVQ